MTAAIWPEKCPKCHQTGHPNGCPGSLPRTRALDMSDTRTAEDAIAQHGFGTSDADQLTKARQEIEQHKGMIEGLTKILADLQNENAKLLTDLKAVRTDLMEQSYQTADARKKCDDAWSQKTFHENRADQLEKMLALIEVTAKTARQLHEQEIPF